MALRSVRKRDRFRGDLVHPSEWTGGERGTQVATVATDQNGPLSISFLGGVHVIILWLKSDCFIEAQTGKDRTG